MSKRIEDFVDNLLIEYEPEETVEAAERLRRLFDDYLDNTIMLQEALLEKGKTE